MDKVPNVKATHTSSLNLIHKFIICIICKSGYKFVTINTIVWKNKNENSEKCWYWNLCWKMALMFNPCVLKLFQTELELSLKFVICAQLFVHSDIEGLVSFRLDNIQYSDLTRYPKLKFLFFFKIVYSMWRLCVSIRLDNIQYSDLTYIYPKLKFPHFLIVYFRWRLCVGTRRWQHCHLEEHRCRCGSQHHPSSSAHSHRYHCAGRRYAVNTALFSSSFIVLVKVTTLTFENSVFSALQRY